MPPCAEQCPEDGLSVGAGAGGVDPALPCLTPEHVAKLIAENRRLKALLRHLGDEAGVPVQACAPPWGLTQQEFALLGCLAKHSPAHKLQMLRAMKIHSRRAHFEEKIVDVVACRVRRKIAPMGFTITSIWGEGKQLCEPGRAAVKQIMGVA